MTMIKETLRRGFTLVEMLVVVSILVLLVGFVVDRLWDSTGKARDAERMKLLSDLDLAIAQYNEDHGSYPEAGCGAGENWVTPGTVDGGGYVSCDEYIVGLVPEYLPRLPLDPRSEDDGNEGFAYRVNDDGYKVMVQNSVEYLFVEDQDDKLSRCDPICLTHPGGAWTDRCTDSEFTRTYALYRDTNDANIGGPKCF